MKRIILFLALLSLGVSKAQVVGGYLPLNSTKSATMGGLRVNGNETVTGTFSVGSTATITGALKVNSTITGPTNLELSGTTRVYLEVGGTAYATLRSTGLRVGDNTDPTAKLDVAGDAKVSSTFSLGSANLTGGNTGTVAVLSDALFGVNCMVASSNPVDATSYTCGITPFTFTGFNTGKVYIPYNSTLVGWTFSAFTNGTPGSSESGTLSININGTSTQLSSAIITSVAVVEYSASGLNTSVTAGNYINAIYTTPTWATNPTSMALGITFWFVRRS